MDNSKLERLTKKHVKRLAKIMGLSQWEITIIVKECERTAEITAHAEYEQAELVICPKRHDTEESVADSVRHELLHLMGANFSLYRTQVGVAVNEGTFDVLDPSYFHAAEKMVLRLERMLNNLKIK